MKSKYIVVLVALSALVLSGCAKPAETANSSGVGARSVETRPSTPDDKITSAVKEKFAADSELKNEKIDITVKDGRVTLTGEVKSDAVRIKAEDTARDVNDVYGVDAEKLVSK